MTHEHGMTVRFAKTSSFEQLKKDFLLGFENHIRVLQFISEDLWMLEQLTTLIFVFSFRFVSK